MTPASIRLTFDRQWQAYILDGRRARDIGPTFASVKAAVRFTDNIDAGMPVTTPLRASDGAPTFVPSAPLAGTESLGAPSEPRLGRPDPHRP